MNNSNRIEIETKLKQLLGSSLTRIEIIALLATFILTFFGNLLVIAFFIWNKLRNKNFKITRILFFIIHLSISDIIVALFSILPQIIWRYLLVINYSNFICKAITFFQVVVNFFIKK